MFLRTDNPRTIQLSGVADYLLIWLEAFLIDRITYLSDISNGLFKIPRQLIVAPTW